MFPGCWIKACANGFTIRLSPLPQSTQFYPIHTVGTYISLKSPMNKDKVSVRWPFFFLSVSELFFVFFDEMFKISACTASMIYERIYMYIYFGNIFFLYVYSQTSFSFG